VFDVKSDTNTKEPFWRYDNPICYATLISLIILVGYFVIGLRSECIGSSCETNFQVFWESNPNEIGDTLAGLFSALAFVWIIATVMLQSNELVEQRKELRQTRREFERMANYQEDEAERKTFNIIFFSLERVCRDVCNTCTWKIARAGDDHRGVFGADPNLKVSFNGLQDAEITDPIGTLFENLESVYQTLHEARSLNRIRDRPSRFYFDDLLEVVDIIILMERKYEKDDKLVDLRAQIAAFRIEENMGKIKQLSALPVWKKAPQ